MSEDYLVDDEFEGLSPPWNFTDPDRQREAAKKRPANKANVEEAFELLERCRRWMVNHPHTPHDLELARRMSLSMEIEAAGLRWFRLLSNLMPTLEDVSLVVAEEAATRPHPEVSGSDVAPAFLPMLARAWAWSFGRQLAVNVSEWLYEHLRKSSDAANRERYLELLTAMAPYGAEVDDTGFIQRIVGLAGFDAVPYLRQIEQHPETLRSARRKAAEDIEYLERMAYPGGDQWPVDIWRIRARRLAKVVRSCVSDHGGPCIDQVLELSFYDGAVLTISPAGRTVLLYDTTPFRLSPESEIPAPEGYLCAHLLAENVICCLADDTDRYPASKAIGRRLTRVYTRDADGRPMNGVIIYFENVRVTIVIISDHFVNITWEVVDEQEP